MTTFAERVEELPEWPPSPKWIGGRRVRYKGHVYGDNASENAYLDYLNDRTFALEARLRLARELLEEIASARVVWSPRPHEDLRVDSGLRANARALLKAMEEPK